MSQLNIPDGHGHPMLLSGPPPQRITPIPLSVPVPMPMAMCMMPQSPTSGAMPAAAAHMMPGARPTLLSPAPMYQPWHQPAAVPVYMFPGQPPPMHYNQSMQPSHMAAMSPVHPREESLSPPGSVSSRTSSSDGSQVMCARTMPYAIALEHKHDPRNCKPVPNDDDEEEDAEEEARWAHFGGDGDSWPSVSLASSGDSTPRALSVADSSPRKSPLKAQNSAGRRATVSVSTSQSRTMDEDDRDTVHTSQVATSSASIAAEGAARAFTLGANDRTHEQALAPQGHGMKGNQRPGPMSVHSSPKKRPVDADSAKSATSGGRKPAAAASSASNAAIKRRSSSVSPPLVKATRSNTAGIVTRQSPIALSRRQQALAVTKKHLKIRSSRKSKSGDSATPLSGKRKRVPTEKKEAADTDKMIKAAIRSAPVGPKKKGGLPSSKSTSHAASSSSASATSRAPAAAAPDKKHGDAPANRKGAKDVRLLAAPAAQTEEEEEIVGGTCPVAGCLGLGHAKPGFATHRSVSGCPLAKAFGTIHQSEINRTWSHMKAIDELRAEVAEEDRVYSRLLLFKDALERISTSLPAVDTVVANPDHGDQVQPPSSANKGRAVPEQLPQPVPAAVAATASAGHS